MTFQSFLIYLMASLSLSRSIIALKVLSILSLMLSLVISTTQQQTLIIPLNMTTRITHNSCTPSRNLNVKGVRLLNVAASMILATALFSCAVPKTSVRVRNNATGSETTISVRNGEGSSTSVNVSPSMQLDSLSFDFRKNDNR